MPAPSTAKEFYELVQKSKLVDLDRLKSHMEKLRDQGALPSDAPNLAGVLVRDGLITHFQAEQLLQGKWKRFSLGKYKVLEKLGQGGMGSVYLCEHMVMKRRVALKVLPTAKAEDPSSLDRFYREARAVAALDHPNIVRAYDIDHEDKLHFLVMEHVDGASLQEIIKRTGPMPIERAAHYVRQAALGLEHASESAGLVHRDIKPGNILVDRGGVVKILDMGLARFFYDEDDDITKKYDENVLGTADYLAPEQALNSHEADTRADIYSLGATFYFCLTGRPPFAEGTVAQKLIWHQTRQPKPVTEYRQDVPEGISVILDRMMAKSREERFQNPREVAEALSPWTQNPIAPPPDEEMPQLSLAAKGGPGSEVTLRRAQSARKTNWEVSIPAGEGSSSTNPAAATPAPAQPAPSAPTQPSTPHPSHPSGTPGAVPTRPSLLQASPVATPQASPVTDAEEEEEDAPWDQLTTDTDDLTSRLDTHRSFVGRKKSPKSKAEGEQESTEPGKSRKWIFVVGLLVVAVGASLAVMLSSSDKKSGGTKPGLVVPKQRLLKVGGPDGKFQSIFAAIHRARPGDRIIVYKQQIKERFDIRVLKSLRRFLKNITVEAAEGVRVVWTAPEQDRNPTMELIHLEDADGIKIKGFVLDGQGKVAHLVKLTGKCPGVVLEDLTLRGFIESGVRLANCEGTAARKVVLRGLLTLKGKPHSIHFVVAKNFIGPPTNDHIMLENCDFPTTPAVKFVSPDKKTPAVGGNVLIPTSYLQQ